MREFSPRMRMRVEFFPRVKGVHGSQSPSQYFDKLMQYFTLIHDPDHGVM